MSSVRILVVENNSIVAEDIIHSLNDLGYEVIEKAKTAKDAIEAVNRLQPDIILMDINLDGEMDGIEAAKRINEKTPTPIIYLTAYSDGKTFERAKKTHPHAYIVKPFVEKDLNLAIDLAIHNFAHQTLENDPDIVPTEHIVKDAVFLKIDKKFIKIPIKDILYVEAARSYCKVRTSDKDFLLTMNLHAFEVKLNHPNFIRVSRSCLVNVTRVDSFEKHKLQIGEIQINISKAYQEDFQKRFLSV